MAGARPAAHFSAGDAFRVARVDLWLVDLDQGIQMDSLPQRQICLRALGDLC
jgi:hypothetical protein